MPHQHQYPGVGSRGPKKSGCDTNLPFVLLLTSGYQLLSSSSEHSWKKLLRPPLTHLLLLVIITQLVRLRPFINSHVSLLDDYSYPFTNQRAFHYEHWQRRALRFAHGFCDQTDSELKAERIDLVSKWLNVFQACYIFLSSFSDPSLLAMVTIM